MGPLEALTAGHSPDRPLLLLAGLVLEAAAGEPWGPLARLPHPVRIMGALVSALDRKLNRETRSDRDRRLRGLLTVGVVCAASGVAASLIASAAAAVPYSWTLELVCIISLLAQRSLYNHVRAVAAALQQEGLEAGRRAVARIVGRDVRSLDAHGIARAAIESCAENFSDGVVAPAFWYLVFGLPGLFVYKAVNTLDSMIGHRSHRYQAFGMAAARLDDLLNLVPARLSGLFIAVAAIAVPGTRSVAALRVMWRQAAKHRSPNAGWPEGAMAGALGLALAGPRRYGEIVVDDPWVGDGTAKASSADILRALSIFVIACLVNAAVVASLLVLSLRM